MRALVVHKPSGRKPQQVKRLVRYCLKPARASADKERVLALVNGLDLAGGDLPNLDMVGDYNSADFLAMQLSDDVPDGRRLVRHDILSLAAGAGEDATSISRERQVELLVGLVRLYAAAWGPGYRFLAVIHGDHQGEESRGLHAHVLFKNSDAKGKALEWSRDDLSRQQSMVWAGSLGVTPTRGTGVKRERGTQMPYPKARNLDAKKIGELTNEQLESLIQSGRLGAGRRNKSGTLTSVDVNGRRIRLATARGLAERERGMAALRHGGASPPRGIAGDGVEHRVATKAPPPPARHAAGRGRRRRSLGVGFNLGRGPLVWAGGGKSVGGNRALRVARTGIGQVKSTMAAVDHLGRVL